MYSPASSDTDAILKCLPFLKQQSLKIVALPFLAIALIICLYLTRKRYPNAPTLRLSTRIWPLYVWDDVRTYQDDITRLLFAGWERYSKHGVNYLLNTPNSKLYIVAPHHFDEIRSAPDHIFNNQLANAEVMQTKHTIHPKLVWDSTHLGEPLRKSLTQAISRKLHDIVDEAKASLNDSIKPDQGWNVVHSLQFAYNNNTRTANRILFGKELTRNPDFHRFSIEYAGILFGGAVMIHHWPEFLKPLIMWLRTDIHATIERAKKLLGPTLRERVAAEEQHDWKDKRTGKPDDVIQWVIDALAPEQRDLDILMYRMLNINAAAVYTTGMTFTDNLLMLAVLPQYQDELRREIVEVFRKENGWTKQGLSKLIKLDSFMTEVSRLCVITALQNYRILLSPYTLSDGTKLPRGTHLVINDIAQSMSSSCFANPTTFDPWRMYRARQQPGHDSRHQFVMTSPTHLTFGHGRHACPGRFFAANELKTLLVLVLMRYEFRLLAQTQQSATDIQLDREAHAKSELEEIIRGTWKDRARIPVGKMIEMRKREAELPADLHGYFW